MRSRLLLLGIAAALCTGSSAGMAQLPERRLPLPGANPEVENPPPTGTLDPRTETLSPITETPDPQTETLGPITETLDPITGTLDPTPGIPNPNPNSPPVVRPGTIQREPAVLPSSKWVYLERGEAPANLRVVATGPTSVTLQWAPTAGAYVYWVHRSHAGGPYYRGNFATDTTTFTVNGLLPGTAYGFKVSAIYPPEMQRREGMSEAVSATTGTAPAPTELTATVVGRGGVSLRWNKVPGANWYRVFLNGAVLSEIRRPLNFGPTASPAQRTGFDYEVAPGTYQYQVQAVYVAGGHEITSALAPVPPLVVTIKASTRVRYCQTMNAGSACGQPGSAPAVIAAITSVPAFGRGAP